MRLGWLLVLAACGKGAAPRETHCVYQDAAYSIGSTRCAPGLMSPPGYQVFECREMGNGPQWAGTSSTCNAPYPAASGSAAGSAGPWEAARSPKRSLWIVHVDVHVTGACQRF